MNVQIDKMNAQFVGHLVGDMRAAADFMGPGSIETNRYQAEILDMVRRRFVFGQKINNVPATGQPSRYFEQLAIPTAAETNPRALSATATQPVRVERPLNLKALMAQINYSIFDVEVNQQQGQFAYLEAKDLTDTVDSVLKLHDQRLWNGNDTDLVLSTTNQYYGVSGQIFNAPTLTSTSPNVPSTVSIASNASLVDSYKTAVAQMVNRTDFEVRPSGIYMNPLLADLFDQEAKSVQLYFNEVEVIPGVIVKALPTAAGLLPLIPDAGLRTSPGFGASGTQYTGFIVMEEYIEYHYLTSPVPRVFQLGLVGNLAGQFTVVKFGGVVAKGASYAHRAVYFTR
jgi:hypothetical protein